MSALSGSVGDVDHPEGDGQPDLVGFIVPIMAVSR